MKVFIGAGQRVDSAWPNILVDPDGRQVLGMPCYGGPLEDIRDWFVKSTDADLVPHREYWTAPGTDEGYATRVRDAIEPVAQAMLLDTALIQRRGKSFLEAAVGNLVTFSRSPGLSAIRITGEKAVLCGGGPSLTADVPILAALRGKVAIVAVDAAAAVLKAAGVAVDLIVSLESDGRKAALDLSAYPPLICNFCVHPAMAGKFGVAIPTARKGDFAYEVYSSLGFEGDIQTGAVSGVYGVHVLAALGFREVAMTGCEMCWREPAKIHAGAETWDPDVNQMRVRDQDGAEVWTVRSMLAARMSKEEIARAGIVRLVQCSRGSLPIAGAARATLEEWAQGAESSSISLELPAQAPARRLQGDILSAPREIEEEMSEFIRRMTLGKDVEPSRARLYALESRWHLLVMLDYITAKSLFRGHFDPERLMDLGEELQVFCRRWEQATRAVGELVGKST